MSDPTAAQAAQDEEEHNQEFHQTGAGASLTYRTFLCSLAVRPAGCFCRGTQRADVGRACTVL